MYDNINSSEENPIRIFEFFALENGVVHSYPPGHLIRDNFVSKRRISNA